VPPGHESCPGPGIAEPFTALHPGVLVSLGPILLMLLVLVFMGVFPAWPYSDTWGYGPVGIVGVLFIVVVVLMSLGKI
jgi:Protein of unknown function (DUF3309)